VASRLSPDQRKLLVRQLGEALAAASRRDEQDDVGTDRPREPREGEEEPPPSAISAPRREERRR
jgi:hypothetical protein